MVPSCKDLVSIFFLVGICVAGSYGCRNDEAVSEVEVAPVARGIDAAPSMRVHPDNEGLVFRYYDKSTGTLATAQGIDAVPEEIRSAVVVMDLNAKGVPARALYVTDLTRTQEDGSHPYQVVDRYAYRSKGVAGTDSKEVAGANVTLYSTEWCGVCKNARKWFQAQGIPFVERDLEKDDGAPAALQAAARKAGMHPSAVLGSVPVIVVGKQIIKGFDASAVTRALGR